MNYCPNCGTVMDAGQRFCTNCGFSPEAARQAQQQAAQPPYGTQAPYDTQAVNEPPVPASPKSRLAALLLCMFVGTLGVHRFYVGKTGTGIVWILTLGCFGVGLLVDVIQIALGNFTDSDGLPVSDWQI